MPSLINHLSPSEVIVVDGRSTDNTIKVATEFPVKVFTESEPSSLPNARNVGVENSPKRDIVHYGLLMSY